MCSGARVLGVMVVTVSDVTRYPVIPLSRYPVIPLSRSPLSRYTGTRILLFLVLVTAGQCDGYDGF
jgi:hypothetical protein